MNTPAIAPGVKMGETRGATPQREAGLEKKAATLAPLLTSSGTGMPGLQELWGSPSEGTGVTG